MESLITTIIHFFFITNTKFIDWEDFEFFFGSEDYNEGQEGHILGENNSISFIPKYPKSCVYYLETIILKYKKIEIANFQFLIYINKDNNIIVDLDETKGSSFELLFYAKYGELLPNKISYKDKEFRHFENYGNQKRNRIFFANVDPNKLQYINSDEMKNYNFNFCNQTYQVLFRLYEKDKFEITMTDMDSYLGYNSNLRKTKIQFSRAKYEIIKKCMMDFYIRYKNYIAINRELDDKMNIDHVNLVNYAKKIKQLDLYNFIKNPDIYEKQYTQELLFLFHIDFSLNQLIKLDEVDQNKFKTTRSKLLDNQKTEQKLYDKLIDDNDLNIEQKIKIIRTVTIFCKNSLNSDDATIFNVSYININNISKQSPYFKSNQMLKELVSEITEESRIFEAFLYFDSKVIENILEKNTQQKYSYDDAFGRKVEIKQTKYITEYGLSLMTVDEIKEHLIDLIPEIIIQIDTNVNINALYEAKTNLMVINEFKLFGNFSEKNEEKFKTDSDYYIVPISMEIMHEMFAHGKLRYNKKTEKSPLVIRDSKHNFKVQVLMKEIKCNLSSKLVNQGESGRVFENYISENKNIIKQLKKRSRNTKIANSKYWTGTNFSDLYKELGLNNEVEKSPVFNKVIMLDDSEEEQCDCMFQD